MSDVDTQRGPDQQLMQTGSSTLSRNPFAMAGAAITLPSGRNEYLRGL